MTHHEPQPGPETDSALAAANEAADLDDGQAKTTQIQSAGTTLETFAAPRDEILRSGLIRSYDTLQLKLIDALCDEHRASTDVSELPPKLAGLTDKWLSPSGLPQGNELPSEGPVETGEDAPLLIVITGPSGAGKSTIARAM